MRRLRVSVGCISDERYRSHTNVERFSLWENPNKSYACVLASLARYKGTAAVTGCLFRITPNLVQEISSVVSKLNYYFILCPYQRDRSVNTRSRNSPD